MAQISNGPKVSAAPQIDLANETMPKAEPVKVAGLPFGIGEKRELVPGLKQEAVDAVFKAADKNAGLPITTTIAGVRINGPDGKVSQSELRAFEKANPGMNDDQRAVVDAMWKKYEEKSTQHLTKNDLTQKAQ